MILGVLEAGFVAENNSFKFNLTVALFSFTFIIVIDVQVEVHFTYRHVFIRVISNILNGVYILPSKNYEKQDLVQAPTWCVHTVKKGQKGTPLTILYINKLVETVLNRKWL